MAAPGAFEKDFGYLMPFLEKVAGAAQGLEDAAAREELVRLMAEEKERWARIRELLSGVPAQGGASQGPKAGKEAKAPKAEKAPKEAKASKEAKAPEPEKKPEAPAAVRADQAPLRVGLTVGSLKGAARK